jgi:3-hydroxyisobutyrate dehydrogenase-like beta-hydroxyacid dehydrogenase
LTRFSVPDTVEPVAKVAVIGLGRIGGGVARALARNRRDDVSGYDPSSDARSAVAEEVRIAPSPSEAAAGAEIALVAVYDDAQVREALSGPDGVLAADPVPGIVVILSTVPAETIRWAAAEASAAGSSVLDCGVTGGHRMLETVGMAAMVGGDRETYERAKPVLDGFTSAAPYMGPLGAGMTAKLARNIVVFGTWYVTSEAARLLAGVGVDVEKFVEISDSGDAMSGGPAALLKRGIRPTEQPRDAEDLARRESLAGYAHKDVEAALALAEELGIELPVATIVQRSFEDAVGLSAKEL